MKYPGEEPFRGRPRGHKSHSTMATLNSIALIAAKYSLDPGLLLDAIAEAQAHEKSQFEKLEVRCRKIDQDYATFLITCSDEVVGQFSMGREILQHPEFFKPHIPTIPASAQILKDNFTLKHISELRAGMRDVTVNARVIEVPKKKLIITKYGWIANVSNVLLADETGTIRLSLWNGQIDDVSMGDTVNIEKASVARSFGALQLRISRNGTMNVDTSTRESKTT